MCLGKIRQERGAHTTRVGVAILLNPVVQEGFPEKAKAEKRLEMSED